MREREVSLPHYLRSWWLQQVENVEVQEDKAQHCEADDLER